MRIYNKIGVFAKLSLMRGVAVVYFLICATILQSQVVLEKPNLQQPTLIAPAYFGPNAFAVPDMLDGRVSEQLRIDLAGDYYHGYYGDKTSDIALSINVPLFTRRVNFSLWMPVVEFYTNTPQSMAYRRINDTTAMRGSEFGDVYLSTDIQLFYEKRYSPDVVLRAALKTASGGGFYKARYYDNAGYFFDLTLAKSLQFKEKYVKELRLAASAGFLCWQTDNGRQNDAVMYGLQLKMVARHFWVSQTWSGYLGWERKGDRPMILKTKAAGVIGDFEPYLQYQYGVKDYPFHQFRVGLAYNIDILKSRKGK